MVGQKLSLCFCSSRLVTRSEPLFPASVISSSEFGSVRDEEVFRYGGMDHLSIQDQLLLLQTPALAESWADSPLSACLPRLLHQVQLGKNVWRLPSICTY